MSPSILGSVLLFGTCVAMFFLGSPRFHHQRHAPLARAVVKATCGTLVAGWMLSEYLLCTPWLCEVAGVSSSSSMRAWLSLMGLSVCQVRSQMEHASD
jgi:hypothetical protein